MGFGQGQQVTLRWQDLSGAVAARRAQITNLARRFSDDQARHDATLPCKPSRVAGHLRVEM
jgi:hypothetical protein